MNKVREAIKGEDADAMKSAIEQLEQASHAFSKTLYESAQAARRGALRAAGAGCRCGELPPTAKSPAKRKPSTPSSK